MWNKALIPVTEHYETHPPPPATELPCHPSRHWATLPPATDLPCHPYVTHSLGNLVIQVDISVDEFRLPGRHGVGSLSPASQKWPTGQGYPITLSTGEPVSDPRTQMNPASQSGVKPKTQTDLTLNWSPVFQEKFKTCGQMWMKCGNVEIALINSTGCSEFTWIQSQSTKLFNSTKAS